MSADILQVFSPLPPEPNGIADYTYHLLAPLSQFFSCAVFTQSPHVVAPAGVAVMDYLQAFRYIKSPGRLLHQIGNNPGHVFVLDALRQWGGVTTLHDQNLHYLHEVANTDKGDLLRLMIATSPNLGAIYGRHWQTLGVKSAANYALFDMLDDILSESTAVIVHSEFAKRRLRTIYGRERSERVVVIPHLALPVANSAGPDTRSALALPHDVPLIITAGFATFAKRFDWLVAALDQLAQRRIDFFWVHAGKERPEEFALSDLLIRHPSVRQRSRITGYLTEDNLNSYILSSDILVNLRFPSVGESSGTLSRAMAAGKSCIVSDTAAYAELPRAAVIHTPVADPIPHLVDTLQALLSDATLRARIGYEAKTLAESAWAPAAVAAAYRDVIEHASPRPRSSGRRGGATDPHPPIHISLTEITTRAEISRRIGHQTGNMEILFACESLAALATLSLKTPILLAAILPVTFTIASVRIESGIGNDADPRPPDTRPVLIRVKGSLP